MGGTGQRATIEEWCCFTCRRRLRDAIWLEVQVEADGAIIAYARCCCECWNRIDEDGFMLRQLKGHDLWVFARCEGVVEIEGLTEEQMKAGIVPRNGGTDAKKRKSRKRAAAADPGQRTGAGRVGA